MMDRKINICCIFSSYAVKLACLEDGRRKENEEVN